MAGPTDHQKILIRTTGATEDSSLLEWTTWVTKQLGHAPALHHQLLLRALSAIGRGTIDRLMVLMPPGSAKSTLTSVLYPAWWLAEHPATSVIATSHTASLAEDFSRLVREHVREHGMRLGYRLVTGSQAARHWRTTKRGEYLCVGVRGPLTGHRADLIIIDDPIKSHAEADSALLRDRLWNWYRADLTTRLKPGGRIVLIMTRWHEDDLAGRLLEQEASEWHIIRLPAIAEEFDPLGRASGSPLWPAWEDESALLRRRNTLGGRVWFTLYQQSPRPPEGSLFRTERIEILDTIVTPTDCVMVRAWDLAASVGENDPDWTVGIKLAREQSGRFIVMDVIRLRSTPLGVQDAVVEAARIDGRSVTVGLPIDPGQAGKHQVRYLTNALAGYHVKSSPESGTKVLRASPVSSQVESSNFAIVRGNWNHAFLEELRDFPFGHKDDQVDALSRAFTLLTETTPARRVAVPFFQR